MMAVSDFDITFVPRFWRMYLPLWLIRRWRLPATPALILPVAVILKRFLAPDLVFSFGILHRGFKAPSSGRCIGTAKACHEPGRSEGAVDRGKGSERQHPYASPVRKAGLAELHERKLVAVQIADV